MRMAEEARPGRFGLLQGLLATLRRRETYLPAENHPLLPLLPLDRLAHGRRSRTEAAIRALATAVPMADRTVLCRVLGRYKMFLDDRDSTHAPHLALDGFWEWWSTAFLARTLRPGSTVIDAGAGYGYFTLLAAELAGPRGKVVAIEPHPHTALLLQRNLALNGMADRVEVVQAALAGPEAPPRMSLLVPPEGPLAAHLAPAGHNDALLPNLTVATRTLDRYSPLRPDVVKLDIAGAEETAWDGMQQLLAECPRIGVLCQFSAAQWRAPEPLLEAMARRFPLRALAPDGSAQATNKTKLLAGGEAMLWLRA